MAMEDYLFPMQSLTTKAAMNPNANMMGLASSPFSVGAGQGSGSGAGLMGLAGLVDQYGAMQDQQQPQMGANQFQSQTPGAPTQPGRIDQTSFGGQGMQTDPLAMLDANINRRFGIV